MIALLQRVSRASVTVGERTVASIGCGLLVLLAVEREDRPADAERMAERLACFRLFPDDTGRMNLNVREAGGDLLLVPQFTLAADTSRGHRPSFGKAAEPSRGQALFERLLGELQASGLRVETGEFGAHMEVALINDGPVTFWLQVPTVPR